MIVCPGCGGNLKFDIESQKMHCAYCDSFINPEDVIEKEKDAELAKSYQDTSEDVNVLQESNEQGLMEVTVYTCPQCGAELMSADTEATSFCSYCGAANILTERVSKTQKPDEIIPFKITKEECKKRYVNKLNKTLFAPKELTNPEHIESFRGIYMPYWSYDVTQKGRSNFEGTTETRDGDYRVIHHYDLSIDMNNTYEGISHDASSSFDDNISESLAPYNTKDQVPFRTAYLSGFYADTADVDTEEYAQEAKAMAANDALENVRKIEKFKKYSIASISDRAKLIEKTNTSVPRVKRNMFPVWFLSYRSEDNRVAYAAINGQTGKVTADIPIDKKKYLISTAVVAVMLWIFLNFVNTPSLAGILKAGIVGATASLIMSTFVVLNVVDRDESVWGWIILIGSVLSFLVGFFMNSMLLVTAPSVISAIVIIVNIKKLKEEHKLRGMASTIILAILTVISGLIWKVDPAEDFWYYVPQVLIALTVIWNFFDVLYYYNKLMTRPLPQFERSGGDDNA